MRWAMLAWLGACSSASSAPLRQSSPIPSTANDLLTVVVDDWSATRATLTRYHRGDHGWQRIGEPWPGVIGYTGAAWGSGLHGDGAPSGHPGPRKREGDGKSPAGVFMLTSAFGYAATAPKNTKLPYTAALDASWQCVDDPKSTRYNQIFDSRGVTRDWKSAEPMRRGDAQYTWAIPVGHNPARTPGGGSCVFVHVWTGEGEPTTGCTAMAEPKMRELIATLDPATVLVLLPAASYRALAADWGLP